MNRTKLLSSGTPFAFTPGNLKKLKAIVSKYPKGRESSALLPVLDIAQRQHDNWLSQEVLETVATTLNLPLMRVYEVATFYTLYNLEPVGKYLVQVCRTTPCWLRGSDDILTACLRACNVEKTRQLSPDQKFTVVEVECLGACANAPMMQVNDDFFEDLTAESATQILHSLKQGQPIMVGSQQGRVSSESVSPIRTGGKGNHA